MLKKTLRSSWCRGKGLRGMHILEETFERNVGAKQDVETFGTRSRFYKSANRSDEGSNMLFSGIYAIYAEKSP